MLRSEVLCVFGDPRSGEAQHLGDSSAKPAPMDFSSLPPTKGILTFT